MRLVWLPVLAMVTTASAAFAQTMQSSAPPLSSPASLARLSSLKSVAPTLKNVPASLQAGQAVTSVAVATAAGTDVPGIGYTQQRFSDNDIKADAVIYPFSNAGNSGDIIRIGGGQTDTVYTIYTGVNPSYFGTGPYNTIPISPNYNTCFSFMPTTAWKWDIAANNAGTDSTVPGSGNILNAGTAIVGLMYKACNAGSGWMIYPPPVLHGSTGGAQTIALIDPPYSCATAVAIVPGALPGMLALANSPNGTDFLAVTVPNTVTVQICNGFTNPATPDARWISVNVLP